MGVALTAGRPRQTATPQAPTPTTTANDFTEGRADAGGNAGVVYAAQDHRRRHHRRDPGHRVLEPVRRGRGEHLRPHPRRGGPRAYPAGGFSGFVIQTEGTGGGTDATPGASDGLLGQRQNTGAITPAGSATSSRSPRRSQENFGLTRLHYTPTDGRAGAGRSWHDDHAAVAPLVGNYPDTNEQREAHEGEPFDVTGDFTVTNTSTPTVRRGRSRGRAARRCASRPTSPARRPRPPPSPPTTRRAR